MSTKPILIVESPSKAKTISKYLRGKYEVMACVGHIKDLPKTDLGVDVDNDFAITATVVMLAAAGYVLINLFVDILYAIIDPRIRLG